jgi:hypothetical protein
VTRGSGGHGTGRSLLAAFAFLLLIGLLSTAPVAAHTFTKSDGNDSLGRLDIRAASVKHKGKNVVHTIRTYEGWTPQSLGNDSYIVVLLDKNFDDDFELCAFVFFAADRLRGSLTNCNRTYIRKLPVSKPAKAVASIKIPTENTGQVYRWVVFSYWTGLPARCSDLCFDAAPNQPPPILHDLKPPVVTMPESNLLRVWDVGTTSDFAFPFEVTDAHSGVDSWTIQRSPSSGSPVWTTVFSGTGSGSKSPTIVGTPTGLFKFRVRAVDKQGNVVIGDIRHVHVPTDVLPTGPGAFSDTGVVETPDPDAWGGGFVPLDATESFTFTFTDPTGCGWIELIGPGSGDWVVEISIGGSIRPILASDLDDSQRQTLWSEGCVTSGTIFILTVESGDGFGIDAIVGNQT